MRRMLFALFALVLCILLALLLFPVPRVKSLYFSKQWESTVSGSIYDVVVGDSGVYVCGSSGGYSAIWRLDLNDGSLVDEFHHQKDLSNALYSCSLDDNYVFAVSDEYVFRFSEGNLSDNKIVVSVASNLRSVGACVPKVYTGSIDLRAGAPPAGIYAYDSNLNYLDVNYPDDHMWPYGLLCTGDYVFGCGNVYYAGSDFGWVGVFDPDTLSRIDYVELNFGDPAYYPVDIAYCDGKIFVVAKGKVRVYAFTFDGSSLSYDGNFAWGARAVSCGPPGLLFVGMSFYYDDLYHNWVYVYSTSDYSFVDRVHLFDDPNYSIVYGSLFVYGDRFAIATSDSRVHYYSYSMKYPTSLTLSIVSS